LVSDKLFVSANNIVGKGNTIFSVARYGNVIGSRGSVIPYFKKLIDAGQKTLPITHKDMTRFWITLEQGVNFVLENFKRMQGGEIFIPKIPSAKIVDLAEAMAPNLRYEIVGIRPGEKLHEVMCPEDDAFLTIEFKDHYVIKPSISFSSRVMDYSIDRLGDKGKSVPTNFVYRSDINNHFLSVNELKDHIKLLSL